MEREREHNGPNGLKWIEMDLMDPPSREKSGYTYIILPSIL